MMLNSFIFVVNIFVRTIFYVGDKSSDDVLINVKTVCLSEPKVSEGKNAL
jgi:hypothetical protein